MPIAAAWCLGGAQVGHNPRDVAIGVRFFRTLMVNVYFVRTPSSWVLIDAGLPGYAEAIRRVAGDFVGSSAPPAAIILTHGHIDHVGSLQSLLRSWDVPVYAHRLELPFLDGRSSYPPPDPLVGKGLMSLTSRLFSRGPIDVGRNLHALPDGNAVPELEEWRCIHTPGHTAGHVSFFRNRDRTLIAGDAVTTVQQESLLAVAMQRRGLHGPPAYFTQNWGAATDSVGHLAALQPDLLASGHGDPLRGPEMRAALRQLASRFEEDEVPWVGRYVKQPAVTNENGIVRLPPDPLPRIAAGVALAAGLAAGAAFERQRRMRHTRPGS